MSRKRRDAGRYATRAILFITIVVGVACAGLFLCFFFIYRSLTDLAFVGEDTWAHYRNGGMFLAVPPSMSSDGQIAFASVCTGQGDIYIFKQNGAHATRLTSSELFESSPVFSPDGRRIAFAREDNGRRHIWLMRADGASETQLTSGNTLDDPKAFSADGRHLIFHRSHAPLLGQGATTRSCVLETGKAASGPIDVGFMAVFTSDSEAVIFSTEQGELWRLDLKYGNSKRRLAGRGWPCGVSMDGRYLVTQQPTRQPGWNVDGEIWVQDLEFETELQIARGHSPVLFNGEGLFVFYFKGLEQTPFVTAIDGGNPVQIGLPPGYKTHPRPSPGGRSIILATGLQTGSPNYDIVLFSAGDMEGNVVASVSCASSSY